MSYLRSLLAESDNGTSLVEYALLVALVAVISVPAVSMAGHSTQDTFQTVGDTLAMADEGDSADQTEDDQSEDGASHEHDDTQDQGSDADQDDSANGSGDSNSSDDSDSSGSSGGNDKSCDNGNNGHNGNCDNQKNCNNQNVGNNGQNCDEDEESDVDDSPDASDVTVSESSSDFATWVKTKHGGEGEWVATFEFNNETSVDRYLKLEVTLVDEKGKTKTTTVDGFLVPAGETAWYENTGNELEVKNGKAKGVVSVQVRIVSISSVDDAGQQITTEIEEPSTTAVAYPTH